MANRVVAGTADQFWRPTSSETPRSRKLSTGALQAGRMKYFVNPASR
jgi:hypothetical protein